VARFAELMTVLTSPHGGGLGDLLLGVFDSLDRLCAQFSTALQAAEHEHLFMVAALVGTLTLVFPAAR